jgi:hypothetical protein
MLAFRHFAISWLAGAVTLVAALAVTSPADFTVPDVGFLLLSFTAVTGAAFFLIAWPASRRSVGTGWMGTLVVLPTWLFYGIGGFVLHTMSTGEAWLFIGAASAMGVAASFFQR